MSGDFKSSDGLRDWFNDLQKRDQPLEIQFDGYFLCLLLGLKYGRRVGLSNIKTNTFLSTGFPQRYSEASRLLSGVLISVEIERQGITFENKAAVQNIIETLIDGDQLSSVGHQRLNEYAHGGFDQLSEGFSNKQVSFADFFATYSPLLLNN